VTEKKTETPVWTRLDIQPHDIPDLHPQRKPLRGLSRLHSMRVEVEAAIEEGLSGRQLAERFQVSRFSVSDWLKETGLRISQTTIKQKRIIHLWETTDMNTAAIADEVSCARSYVGTVLRDAGLVRHTRTLGRPAGSTRGKRPPAVLQTAQQGMA
jgi:predicted DNA-binding protein YlxM (UPF0122 family)